MTRYIEPKLSDFQRGFQAGAASRDAEVARLKTVPMRYRRMAFNAQLQDEVARLEQENDQLRETLKDHGEIQASLCNELDQLRAHINALRNAIKFWMRAEGNYDLMKADKLFQEALAATHEQPLAEYRNKVIEE